MSDARDARDDEPGTTPEVDVSEAEPEQYEPVGPASKEGRSITIPALLVALAIVIYAIVFVVMR